MNSSSFSNDEYTIAWICALPEELEAALFMLDERHEPPQTHDEYDENIYELGTIWRHKVVITCLPRGGLSPATRCVERFSRAFRKIRCWFMVGIGGGVPGGKVDIRLGDVVVSVPSDDSSGIIQFDKGKYGRDGFTRTGVLDSPRELLLNAVNHFGRCPQVKALLDIAKMLPALPKKASEQKGWLHQGMDNDVLYCCYSTGSRCTCDSENCDDKGRIARAPRENYNPKVFRGIIGSSNAVIKDAWTREQLREKHNILCVETEAAGLMESQKFLIVRGIADYADWHKNDDWQQYAALMAATYTRELLRVVPVVRSGVPLPRERIFTVPFGRNLGFVGRAKYIADVESGLALATPRDFCAKVALVGLGGIGKTHIAIEIAYRISNLAKGDHVSLPFHLDIFWINASTYDSFCLAYCKIADKGLKRIADRQLQQDTVEKALEAITEYLEAPESGKWLLIVDGADNPNIWSAKNADTNSLFSYLPRRNGSGSILFTTRNRKNAVDLAANGKVLEVEAMSQEEAVELFISRVTKHGPCAELSVENLELAPKAVETLCFLPLAICQAAAYIRSRAYSVKSYMLEYDDTEEDILVVLSEDFDDDGRSYAKGRNAIATTWFITFEFIKRHSPSAIRLLLQMACLDPSSSSPQAYWEDFLMFASSLNNNQLSKKVPTTTMTIGLADYDRRPQRARSITTSGGEADYDE
ncbi:purine and uridine phosphorylase [Ascobolus immersus RN42]|uniref:Purine and uridine phosphorylase n=1 Tax=Ascobolus immersus RN42 TaxID=1160509 RepID=A0A3N4HQ79_ASCIM|nr:purine and uridine phosphorylase [Ascobolus immersus RN42]